MNWNVELDTNKINKDAPQEYIKHSRKKDHYIGEKKKKDLFVMFRSKCIIMKFHKIIYKAAGNLPYIIPF